MKILPFYLPILIGLFIIGNNAAAQKTIIELDTLTLTPSATLPFDESFILKVPIASSSVSYVMYIEHHGAKTLKQSFQTGSPLESIPINTFSVKKQGTQNYLLITIENPHLLNPGKTYSFVYISGVADIVSALDNYREFANNGNLAAKATAQKLIDDMGQKAYDQFGFKVIFDRNNSAGNMASLKSFYDQSIIDLPSRYAAFEAALTTQTHIVSNLPALSTNLGLAKLVDLIVQRNNALDPQMKLALLKDAKLTMIRLNRLLAIKAIEDYRNLISGVVPLDCDDCKAAEPRDYDAQLRNIKNAVTGINELKSLALALKHVPDVPTALPLFTTMNTDLNSASASLKNLQVARKPILDGIIQLKLGNAQMITGTSVIKNFDSRNKLSIAPDFGVVTTKLFKGNNPYPFVPYLGFHVNFRPLNRDVAWKTYNHKFISYWSLFFGWSLVNIANGPHLEAKADSISGFFNGTKGTLMTGLGYRLGNAVRITFGSMYYFQYQATNVTTPTVYDKRHLKAWPFVGLSIDLAFKDLLNGVQDIFASAPKRYNPPLATSN